VIAIVNVIGIGIETFVSSAHHDAPLTSIWNEILILSVIVSSHVIGILIVVVFLSIWIWILNEIWIWIWNVIFSLEIVIACSVDLWKNFFEPLHYVCGAWAPTMV